MPYARDYSVIEIKKLMMESELYGGHGMSKHHNISDSDAIYYNKSAFLNFAYTNAVREERYSTRSRRRTIWHTREIALYTRTVSDQPFMVAQILNSEFGQAALKLLDNFFNSRIVIHARPMNMGMGMANMNMRSPSGNSMVEGEIGRIVIVIEGGWANVHFVTAYPTMATSYYFKFGSYYLKNTPQTLPGIEHTYNNGTQRRVWQWNNHDQNHGSLLWKW